MRCKIFTLYSTIFKYSRYTIFAVSSLMFSHERRLCHHPVLYYRGCAFPSPIACDVLPYGIVVEGRPNAVFPCKLPIVINYLGFNLIVISMFFLVSHRHILVSYILWYRALGFSCIYAQL